MDWSPCTSFLKVTFFSALVVSFVSIWSKNPFQCIHKLNLPIVELPNCIFSCSYAYSAVLSADFHIKRLYNNMPFRLLFCMSSTENCDSILCIYEICDWSNVDDSEQKKKTASDE